MDISGPRQFSIIDYFGKQETRYFSDEFSDFIQEEYRIREHKDRVHQENITNPGKHRDYNVDFNDDMRGVARDGWKAKKDGPKWGRDA